MQAISTKTRQHQGIVRVNIARVAVCCVRALFAEACCPKLYVGSCVSTCWVSSWSSCLRSISGTHAVPSIIKDICFEAATFKHLTSNDSLFHESTDAKGAFLVVSGRLLYFRNPDMSLVDTFEEQIVEQDTWLCEAALWTYWVHMGACEAKSISLVVVIQAILLDAVVWRHRHIRELAVAYASAFHKKLLEGSCRECDITDIAVPGTYFEDVIETMPNEAKRIMGEAALKKEIAFTREETAYWRALQTLEGEVAHDRCFLFFNVDQQLRRLAWWTSARVRHRFDNDLFLVVLGSVEDGHVTPTCRLPATNRSGTDDLCDPLRHLIDLELSPLSPWLRTVSVSGPVETHWEEDTRFNVRSRYRHTMCEVRFDGDLEAVGTRMPGHQVNRWKLLAQHSGDVCEGALWRRQRPQESAVWNSSRTATDHVRSVSTHEFLSFLLHVVRVGSIPSVSEGHFFSYDAPSQEMFSLSRRVPLRMIRHFCFSRGARRRLLKPCGTRATSRHCTTSSIPGMCHVTSCFDGTDFPRTAAKKERGLDTKFGTHKHVRNTLPFLALPCITFLVPCSLFLVPCSLFLVPCSFTLVP